MSWTQKEPEELYQKINKVPAEFPAFRGHNGNQEGTP